MKLTDNQKYWRREMLTYSKWSIAYIDCSNIPKIKGNTVFAFREERAGHNARIAARYAFLAHPELREEPA